MNKIIAAVLIFFYNASSFSEENTIDPDNSKIVPNFVGTIILSKGQITKMRQSEEISASKEGKILSKDIIKTGKASVVKMKMVDDTIISLGPETELEISKFIFKGRDDRQSVFYLSQGQVRAHFPVKAKVGDIEFKTKITAMGIRGTTLLANVQKENKENEQSEYLLLEGKIDVKNLINGKINELAPGDHYILNSRSKGIEEMHFEEDKKILEELNASSLDELNDLKPFLPYHISGKENERMTSVKEKGRTPASVLEVSDQEGRPFGDRQKREAQQWKKTLNELNRRLRRNTR